MYEEDGSASPSATPPGLSYADHMTVSAHAVAAALRERLPDIPAVKLQKLLYYCQGHHLAHFDEPLFSDTISAWKMGPVVPAVWHEGRQGPLPEERDMVRPPLDEAVLNTVGYVVSRYGVMTGRELTILSHGEAPWRRANERQAMGGAARIEVDWIKQYFQEAELADREDAAAFDPTKVAEIVSGAVERAGQRESQTTTPDALEDVLAWAHRGA
jgi:uncharacterized phage-associated protein